MLPPNPAGQYGSQPTAAEHTVNQQMTHQPQLSHLCHNPNTALHRHSALMARRRLPGDDELEGFGDDDVQQTRAAPEATGSGEQELDEYELFMAGIDQQVRSTTAKATPVPPPMPAAVPAAAARAQQAELQSRAERARAAIAALTAAAKPASEPSAPPPPPPQPRPPSPPREPDGGEDDLDDFFASIEAEVKQEQPTQPRKSMQLGRLDEEDDGVDAYVNLKANIAKDATQHGMEVYEYDSDDNPIVDKNREIDPLPAVDHGSIPYEKFERNFYKVHPDIAALTPEAVQTLRDDLGISVSGAPVPAPLVSFAHAGFDDRLMGAISKAEFSTLTPIQAQALPVALSGRDVVGIAQTGSGKTLAFVWPMLVHIMAQRHLAAGEGPIAVILAPTRELAAQIYLEARKFAKAYRIEVCPVYGGVSKWEQTKALKAGCEVVVATPGRLIDMIKSKATNLHRVTYLVLDEADKMLDMGFENQVRSIMRNVRPDRQTLLFTATMKRSLQSLANDGLRSPVRITIGTVGQSSADVLQKTWVVRDAGDKWEWLMSMIGGFVVQGKVLIFVNNKQTTEDLTSAINKAVPPPPVPPGATPHGIAMAMHGDKQQYEREEVIRKFKDTSPSAVAVLVATDVAARGLDIKNIRTVVNYDVAINIDTHVHRVGRTGRMGIAGVDPGTAHTLLTHKDANFAFQLVDNLHKSGQSVAADLRQLASRATNKYIPGETSGKGKGKGTGRPTQSTAGLGFDSHDPTADATGASGWSIPAAPAPVSRHAPTGMSERDRILYELGSESRNDFVRRFVSSGVADAGTNQPKTFVGGSETTNETLHVKAAAIKAREAAAALSAKLAAEAAAAAAAAAAAQIAPEVARKRSRWEDAPPSDAVKAARTAETESRFAAAPLPRIPGYIPGQRY